MVTQDIVTLKNIQAQESGAHIKTIKEIINVKSYKNYLVKSMFFINASTVVIFSRHQTKCKWVYSKLLTKRIIMQLHE